MRNKVLLRFAVLLALSGLCPLLLHALGREEGRKQPVYVGVKVCATCHRGRGMGHQHAKWLLSKHSRAYAALARPESKQIARLSGIPQEPQASAVCLGCHATGAEAEDWEMDETFHLADGVQCERCHGPGSEYMDADTMRDPKAAEAAGLVKPTKKDCMGCHQVKGSHVAVLQSPAVDREKAWREIAHPAPPEPKLPGPSVRPKAPAPGARPKYTGVAACAACHRGPGKGYQSASGA